MTLKKTIFFFAVALTFMLQSCNEYKTTDDGLKYKIIVDSTGPTLQYGGTAVLHMTYYNGNGKDTFSSIQRNMGRPIEIHIPDSIAFKASLEEGLTMLSKGDSASFIMSTDSLFKLIFHAPLPKEITPGGQTTFFVRIVDVITPDSAKAIEKIRQEQMIAAQIQRQLQQQMQFKQDSLDIVAYCKKKGLRPKRTLDGVSYVVTKAAEGITVQPGDTAKTYYTGKLLDGSTFDSNVGKEPFPVVVGMGQVIRGWDSGLMALKKGEKATLIIPSTLAYGERGAGGRIPPNAVLVFDVEILK